MKENNNIKGSIVLILLAIIALILVLCAYFLKFNSKKIKEYGYG